METTSYDGKLQHRRTHRTRFERILRAIGKIVKKQFPAVLMLLSRLSGTLLAGLWITRLPGFYVPGWELLALATALNGLPHTYAMVDAHRNEPLLLLFARCFHDGFVPMSSLTRGFASLIEKIVDKLGRKK